MALDEATAARIHGSVQTFIAGLANNIRGAPPENQAELWRALAVAAIEKSLDALTGPNAGKTP